MFIRGKKALTRKVLLGMMTASVLYGGGICITS